MHLRSVKLRNWRSYRNAQFEFPAPIGDRNVILVRAPNEYGKTSFLEAVTLGLFGRKGLLLIPRANHRPLEGGAVRPDIRYSNFLAAVLHRGAAALGEQSCSVTLKFDDDNDDIVEIRRTWHFNSSGQHQPDNDEMLVFEGRDNRPVAPPVAETNKDEFYSDFVSRRLIAPDVAEFFLFDGEQVQRYADRGAAEQVRAGIERLLGLPLLRHLQESLRGYAKSRRSKAGRGSSKELVEVERRIEKLENDAQRQHEIVEKARFELKPLKDKSAELSINIGGRQGDSARIGELVEEEHRFRTEAERHRDELGRFLAEDIALALCGVELGDSTIARLQAEKIRESWEIGKRRDGSNLGRYLEDLASRLRRMKPLIDESRQEEIVAAARDAWDALWHPPPEECADDYRHSALMGRERDQALACVEKARGQSASRLQDLVHRFRRAIDVAEHKKRERLRIEQDTPQVDVWVARLKEVNEQIGKIRGDEERAAKAERSLLGELNAQREARARIVESMERYAPYIRWAGQAEALADRLDEILTEAVPSQCDVVARAMTGAWKSMAHMEERIDRIEISPDCEVRMLNLEGEDIHSIQKSAGGSQIFTQALIWAITHVSGRSFPFIVDTPLARLSRDHRLRVLSAFPNRSGQVVLLSTDEEVVGEKLDAIRHRIAAALRLSVEVEGGVMVTTVETESI